jgi:hypothetical protein
MMTFATVIAARNMLLDDIESQLFTRTEDAKHVNHAIMVKGYYDSALKISIVVKSLVYSKHQNHYRVNMGK